MKVEVPWSLNRTELAWAAGFFDGEGCCRPRSEQRKGRGAISFVIAQTDRQVLDRFKRAVGVGRIYGPYKPRTPRHSKYYVYNCAKFSESVALAGLLWWALSPIKRKDIKTTFTQYFKGGRR